MLYKQFDRLCRQNLHYTRENYTNLINTISNDSDIISINYYTNSRYNSIIVVIKFSYYNKVYSLSLDEDLNLLNLYNNTTKEYIIYDI